MCGIIGFCSDERTLDGKTLLKTAYMNRHRGQVDGFGIINLDVNVPTVGRYTYGLEEMVTEKLHKSRGEKRVQYGIVEYRAFEEDYYNKKQDRFNKLIDEMGNTASSRIILHHRAASAGSVALKNTHPIRVDEGVYCVHNGTLYGWEALKNWVSLINDWDFTSDTDTELLGKIVEYLYAKNKNNGDKTFENIQQIFPVLGVYIRLHKKQIEIWKDRYRTLWFYRKGTEVAFISEPVADITDFDELYEMKEGYFKIGDSFNKKQFNNFTDNWKNAQTQWEKCVQKNYVSETYKRKCDDCSEEKFNIASIPYNGSNRNKTHNICYQCMVRDGKLTVYG